MDLQAIRKEARIRLKDTKKPYKWADEWLDSAINEAEREACIRARLIEDKSSSVSSIDIVTTEKRYPLDPAVLDVLACELESRPGREICGWTLTEAEIVFADYPAADDVLLMTVIRLPLEPMVNGTDKPEIRSHHHIKLVDWVLHRAYGVHGADLFDAEGEAKYLGLFEQSFGRRPDANVQRKCREKTGRVVRMNPF